MGDTPASNPTPFRRHAEDWEWYPGRAHILRLLLAADPDMRLAIITNQGGVAIGKLEEAEIEAAITGALAREGLPIVWAGICYTLPSPNARPPYRVADDQRRKPGGGMIREAMAAAGVTPAQTLMIGDDQGRADGDGPDAGAAAAAGVAFCHADIFFGPPPTWATEKRMAQAAWRARRSADGEERR